MAQLNSIIGSILRDMVLAQHQSNLYAASLAEIYSKEGPLERFPLPGIALGDLEIDLHYAIDGDNKEEGSDDTQYEINYPELRRILVTLSDSYSTILITTICNTIKNLFPVESTTGENPLSKFEIPSMRKTEFESFLSRKIQDKLRSKFTMLVDENGNIDKQKTKKNILGVVEKELIQHEDLKELLDKQPDSKAKLTQALTAAVETSFDTILQETNVMRRRLMPSAEITIDSESLAKLPSDSIQRIRLKLSPRERLLFDEPEE